MRPVSAGSLVSRQILRWELLVEISECWAGCLKKKLCTSLPGLMRNSNAQAFRQTNWRKDDKRCTAVLLNMKKLLVEAPEGFRRTPGLVCASTGKSSSMLLKGVAVLHQMPSNFSKSVSTDASPADHEGWPGNAIEFFKDMQQSWVITFAANGLPEKSRSLVDKTHMVSHIPIYHYEGRENNLIKESTDQTVNRSNSKHFEVKSPYLCGSFGRGKEMHGNRSGTRSFSTSTEKQFDDDAAGGSQGSVPGQQQSSLGGQQSSLEVPDSKPVGGPSWPNPDNAASYVLMSNIYADGDRWDEVKRINEMRLKARAWKKPGKAYVEIQAKVHEFIVGDRTHQDSTNIYEKLRKIKRHMGHIGYVPYVDLVLENRSYYDPYSKPR